MAKAKRYSTEQIQAAQKQLRALSSQKSGKTKKEVVGLLAEDVRKAVKEGHSLKAIQDMLRQVDIPVSLAQMKALLGDTVRDTAPSTTSAAENAQEASV